MYDYLQLTSQNIQSLHEQMIKQENFFEEDERGPYHTSRDTFYLTDQQRSNINKRLPVGFSLVKLIDLPKTSQFDGSINFVGGKRQIRIASQQLAKQFAIQTQVTGAVRKEGRGEEKGLRGQLPQGRSKHGEKIKNILQRFRKHPKFTPLSQHLTRLGFANALIQIEAQNRKNIHTIQSFKQRLLYLINQALNVTYEPEKIGMINQMIDEINFLVEIAQKAEFANSLFGLQKSIDKVTRQISDIKQSGSYYYRKRKRNQKNYEEKELLYLAQLMKALPPRQMVGVIEIIEQKPFNEINLDKVQFDLNLLKNKKVRQIEFYVKKKLSNYYKSVERKHQKRQNKMRMELNTANKINETNNNTTQQPSTEVKKENIYNPSFQNQSHLLKMQENPEPERREAYQNEVIQQDEYARRQAQIAHIFQNEYVEDQDDRRAASSYVQPSQINNDRGISRSENSDEYYNDNFFAESSRSHPQQSGYQSSVVRQTPNENLEFQQPNLYQDKSNQQDSKMQYRDNVEQNYVFQSSDSSYITEEDDSQF